MARYLLIFCLILFIRLVSVEGVSMNISPPSIILNYPSTDQPAKTIFRCGSPTATDISYLILRMSRLTSREVGDIPQTIVSIRQDNGPVIPTLPDIQNRGTAGGAIDKTAYNLAYISLEFNTVELQCDDVGQYFYELTYDDINLNTQREISSMNFTASALPSDISLTAKKDGFNIDGSQIFPAKLTVGQEIEFTCVGKIGSDPNTELLWAKTGPSGHLLKFQPQAYPDNAAETQETATPVTGQCTNIRRATLKYNITSTDTNPIGSLQFRCYVEVTPFQGGNPYSANSTTTFYIEVVSAYYTRSWTTSWYHRAITTTRNTPITNYHTLSGPTGYIEDRYYYHRYSTSIQYYHIDNPNNEAVLIHFQSFNYRDCYNCSCESLTFYPRDWPYDSNVLKYCGHTAPGNGHLYITNLGTIESRTEAYSSGGVSFNYELIEHQTTTPYYWWGTTTMKPLLGKSRLLDILRNMEHQLDALAEEAKFAYSLVDDSHINNFARRNSHVDAVMDGPGRADGENTTAPTSDNI